MSEQETASEDFVREALQAHSDFEMAQLGDLLWMTSSLRDLDLADDARARWRAEIETCEAKVQAALVALWQACGGRSPEAIRQALDAQGDVWSDIDALTLRFVRGLPGILENPAIHTPGYIRDMIAEQGRSER